MNIGEKLKIIELLEKGETVASIARKFNVNESTIRTIRNNKNKIRESSSGIGAHAKLSKVIRNVNLIKMEDLLITWIQDLIHKKIPLDGKTIRQQAINFFQYLEEKNETNYDFHASQGWFERYKKRYHLHNVRFTGKIM